MSVRDPAERALEDAHWKSLLRHLQLAHRAQDSAAKAAAEQALAAVLFPLAESLAAQPQWKRALGAEGARDAARDTVLGTDRRAGLLDTLAQSYLPEDLAVPGLVREEKPTVVRSSVRAYVYTAICNRLLDALRSKEASTEPEDVAEALSGTSFGEDDPSPTALPGAVGRALGEACAFTAVAWRLAAADPSAGALGDAFAQLGKKPLADWGTLSAFLEHDVGLGADRPRWGGVAGEVPTLDNHARAWQAAYHAHEEHDGYVGDDEIPAAADAARARYDQHVSRFAKSYRLARDVMARVVANRPAGADPRGARALLPHEWDAPAHRTLEGRKKAAREPRDA